MAFVVIMNLSKIYYIFEKFLWIKQNIFLPFFLICFFIKLHCNCGFLVRECNLVLIIKRYYLISVRIRKDQNYEMHGISCMEVRYALNQEVLSHTHLNLRIKSVQIHLGSIRTLRTVEVGFKSCLILMLWVISVQTHVVYLRIEH